MSNLTIKRWPFSWDDIISWSIVWCAISVVGAALISTGGC